MSGVTSVDEVDGLDLLKDGSPSDIICLQFGLNRGTKIPVVIPKAGMSILKIKC